MVESVTIRFSLSELRALMRRCDGDIDRGYQPLRLPDDAEAELTAFLKLVEAQKGALGVYPPDLTVQRAAIAVLIQRLLPKAVKAKGNQKAKPAPARRATLPRKPRPSEVRKRAARRGEAEPPLPLTLDEMVAQSDEDRES